MHRHCAQLLGDRRELGREGDQSETQHLYLSTVAIAAGNVDSGHMHCAPEGLKATAGKEGDPREDLPEKVTQNSCASLVGVLGELKLFLCGKHLASL